MMTLNNEVVIIIPVYRFPDIAEQVSFKQCIKVLRDYSYALVTYQNLNVSFFTDLFEKSDINYSVQTFDKSCFDGITAYNRLLLSREFYEAFGSYEYMLIYQLDAYVFDDQLNEWCAKAYDYIGAPWFEDFGNSHKKSGLKAVGNGGFSLRRIPAFLAAFDFMDKRDKRISVSNYWNCHLMHRYYGCSPRFILSRFFGKTNTLKYFLSSSINEDAFWSQVVPEAIKAFRVAPILEAVKFAFEADPGYLYELNGRKLPFGCHAWQKNQYDTFWSDYIKIENRIV